MFACMITAATNRDGDAGGGGGSHVVACAAAMQASMEAVQPSERRSGRTVFLLKLSKLSGAEFANVCSIPSYETFLRTREVKR